MKKRKNIQPLDFDMASEAYQTAGVEATPSPSNEEKKSVKQTVYDWDRFCFICDKVLVAKVKAIAEKEGLSIRELMEHMITIGISRYERKNGAVNVDVPISKKKIKDII